MLLIALAATVAGAQVSPFGVCAHLGRGDEFNQLEEEPTLMEEAGIAWARADWSWSQ